MQDIYIAPQHDKPEIAFCFSRNHLAIRGLSYPVRATAFYAPLASSLMTYLEKTSAKEIVVDVELSYFNANSSKILRGLFHMLDKASSNRNVVRINWIHHSENDALLEFASDVAAEFVTLKHAPVIAGDA